MITVSTFSIILRVPSNQRQRRKRTLCSKVKKKYVKIFVKVSTNLLDIRNDPFFDTTLKQPFIDQFRYFYELKPALFGRDGFSNNGPRGQVNI